MSGTWRRKAQPRPSAARPRGFWRKAADIGLAIAILAALAVVSGRLDQAALTHAQGAPAVTDGDSLTLSGQRIRLVGIDAPEYGQICRRDGQDYGCGRSARDALLRLIDGRPVTCAGRQHDRYGRFLGLCQAGATNLNRTQVLEGWAVSYGDFEAEQAVARRNRAGLWAGTFDMPRQWRDTHGGAAEEPHNLVATLLDWLRGLVGFSPCGPIVEGCQPGRVADEAL